MNFKKTWKRFWTLSRASEGFTLVELIVVIAILAILAGIAVPAYSGYIKKANKAADLQLLGAVNTAFAAAALENGEDVNDITSAAISLSADKTVGAVTAPAAFDEAFQRYYAGNTGSFKVIESLIYDSALHVFVDGATENVTVSYGGTSITISGRDAQTLANSTFGTQVGASTLLGMVNDVTDFASLLEGTMYNTVVNDEAYKTAFTATFGLSADQYDIAIDQLSRQRYDLLRADSANASISDADLLAQARNEVEANGAVLYAASNSSSVNTANMVTSLKNGTAKADIVATMNSGASGQALSEAALAYGMYTAYVYQLDDNYTEDGKTKQDLINSLSDPTNILNGLNNDGFKAYMNTDEATADLDGYMSALNMVNTGTAGNPNAVSSVLVNGFTDPNLVALLQQTMGN